MKFRLEVEATDEEVKSWATDVAARTAARVLGKAASGYSRALDDLVHAAGNSGLLDRLGAALQSAFSPGVGARPHRPTPQDGPLTCGFAGPGDTVDGAMWEPCTNPVEFVVDHPQFGNRGRVSRACCAKHKDYLVGGMADCKVTRVAPPAPPKETVQ
jgi:hypothetical protein